LAGRGGSVLTSAEAWAPLRFHDHLNDFLCPDEVARRALVPALVAHLRRNPEGLPLLAVGPFPVDSELWDGVRTLGHGDPCMDPRGVVCGLDCSMPYDKLMARVPRHFRRVLALARNRLAPLRDVHYVTAREPDELQAEWRSFLEVEASGWKGADSSAVRCMPGQAPFFLALAATLRGLADFCEITALYADGRCIASTFGTRTGSTYSMLKICYDEAYGRMSPGQLLLAKVIERCCGDPGIDLVDFVSDASWLRGWQILSVPVKLAYLDIGGLRGRVILALLKVRFGLLRRIAHRLGPKLGKLGIPVPERT